MSNKAWKKIERKKKRKRKPTEKRKPPQENENPKKQLKKMRYENKVITKRKTPKNHTVKDPKNDRETEEKKKENFCKIWQREANKPRLRREKTEQKKLNGEENLGNNENVVTKAS